MKNYTEKFLVYDQIKAQGWCVDWFKELFEDAWSVLAIGEPFLDYFKDILSRNAAKDNRHPPLEVRLSVAKEMLKLLNPQREIANEPNPVEEIAAEQILKFISLLIASARKFESPDDVLLPITPQIISQNIRDWLFAKVKTGIQQSITNWSGEFLSTANPLLKARNSTQIFLDIFSDPDLKILLSELDKYETNQIKSSYRALLKNKNHRQLLKLSFSEVDFHTPGDIQLLESGRTYWVKRADWGSTIWLTQRHQAGNGGIQPNEIILTEVDRQIDWKVRIADWNGWFKMTQ